ncbi:MAG: M20/M25/M40 family metallo-hydrolase [Rhodospirillaceae bacterium]|nr:M20/M25/M40 family metallo-hydrolase [Rhodospirillaceae bacterium]
MADNTPEPIPETPPGLRDYLVARRAEQFAFLSALVRINSENPPGHSAGVTRKLEELLLGQNFTIERRPVDADAAMALGREPYDMLSVSLEFGDDPAAGPMLVLACHADTAPAGQDWTHDPQGAAIDGGRMFGRGVSDGKGDLAAYVYALLAVRDCADGLQGRVQLLIGFDGASGGELGPHRLLAGADQQPNFAIVPGAARAIGTTATGVLDLDVSVKGVSAPAGSPQMGADALEGAAAVLSALYRHRDTLSTRTSEIEGIGSPTLVVTEIRGGEGALAVPGEVTMLVDRRLLPEEDAKAVESEVTNIIGRAAAPIQGVVCRVRRRRLLHAVVPGDEVSKLRDLISAVCEQVTEERPAVYGAAFETSARDFAAADVPVVMYGAGSVGATGHMATRPDEALVLDDLRVATEVLANAIIELLGGQASSSTP